MTGIESQKTLSSVSVRKQINTTLTSLLMECQRKVEELGPEEVCVSVVLVQLPYYSLSIEEVCFRLLSVEHAVPNIILYLLIFLMISCSSSHLRNVLLQIED